jgi:hypothetical protein
MKSALSQLRARIADLEQIAGEVSRLARQMSTGYNPQPELATKGQQWYRACRGIMVQNDYSGLSQFDTCYSSSTAWVDISRYISWDPITQSQTNITEGFNIFSAALTQARSLVLAIESELSARELDYRTVVSYEVAANEFDTAEQILNESRGEEVFVRASGVIARVALERHLFAVADVHSITILVPPPSKRKPEASDVINALKKEQLITAVQKSTLESLFKIGNNCAHPREAVLDVDVERLIRDGKQLAAVIL